MRYILLLTALLAAGCDPFTAAQNADSVEGYETFLAENANSPWRPQAEDRLRTLMFDAAKEENTLPAYDRWLARFPAGSMRDEVMAAREDSLFQWARGQDTVEAWDAFLAEYPTSRKHGNAEKGRRTAEFRGELRIENTRASRTNLAENPDGPLNGWLIEADVTNIGAQPFKTVVLSPTEPTELETLTWPVAAERWTLPLTDDQKRPLRAGETRTWSWTTDALDESWDGAFALKLTDAAR